MYYAPVSHRAQTLHKTAAPMHSTRDTIVNCQLDIIVVAWETAGGRCVITTLSQPADLTNFGDYKAIFWPL